jgi:hypothetical protein
MVTWRLFGLRRVKLCVSNSTAGQERCMRSVRATGASSGSKDKSSEFLLGSRVGHGRKFVPGKIRLETNVLNKILGMTNDTYTADLHHTQLT